MGEQITSTKSIDQNPFRSGRPFPWKRRVTLNCISSNWKIELLPSHNKVIILIQSPKKHIHDTVKSSSC
ncbi:hypothetical protein RclHR1_19590003 [Rhizophagus clarus]|uniref:Uncharacterized protein n=1 Tax=Rhizophagus clarus TaxID=94130 RepID=A0A2Z6QPT5_9GLOM|nr:hypothetical protein RclHR1_19590003 [Rhizophagus clarus]